MTRNMNEADLERVHGGLSIAGERSERLVTVGPDAPENYGNMQRNGESS